MQLKGWPFLPVPCPFWLSPPISHACSLPVQLHTFVLFDPIFDDTNIFGQLLPALKALVPSTKHKAHDPLFHSLPLSSFLAAFIWQNSNPGNSLFFLDSAPEIQLPECSAQKTTSQQTEFFSNSSVCPGVILPSILLFTFLSLIIISYFRFFLKFPVSLL